MTSDPLRDYILAQPSGPVFIPATRPWDEHADRWMAQHDGVRVNTEGLTLTYELPSGHGYRTVKISFADPEPGT